MSETKFTPGPWDKVVKMDGYTAVGARALIARVFSVSFRDTTNEAANANLIAAAPDLYSALEAVLIMWDRGPEPRKLDEAITWRENDEIARAMAAAALAKARGEA